MLGRGEAIHFFRNSLLPQFTSSAIHFFRNSLLPQFTSSAIHFFRNRRIYTMKLASSLRQSLAFGALLLTAALMAFGLSSWALGSRGNSARTQPQGRKIERPKFPEEPFEITDLKVKGNKVNAGESFEN